MKFTILSKIISKVVEFFSGTRNGRIDTPFFSSPDGSWIIWWCIVYVCYRTIDKGMLRVLRTYELSDQED